MTEINLFDREENHHNCLVQIWSNSRTGESSTAWKHDEERVAEILAYVCDELCRFPFEYKDSETMWNERCDRCRLVEMLGET